MADAGLRAIAIFLEKLEPCFSTDALYRGHADSTWTITPSAFREDRHGIINRDQLNRWRRIAIRFASPRPQNDFEWLVLAQHYGIATPLLDWTTNPLVALFFACQRTESDARGCVIRFRPHNFRQFKSPHTMELFKEDRSEPGMLDASAMNVRTLAQDSVMSLHARDTIPLIAAEEDTFGFPSRLKPLILNALRPFGFTPERVYSDLTVAARRFNDELEVDALF